MAINHEEIDSHGVQSGARAQQFKLIAMAERQIPRKRLTRLGIDGVVRHAEHTSWTRLISWREADTVLSNFLDRPITWRIGPGGDEHQEWEVGDVLAHLTTAGIFRLFHFVGRHQGHDIDDAPLVVHLDWKETCLPQAPSLPSLIPHRMWSDGACRYVLVHDDDDALDGSALRRIGNFTPNYEISRSLVSFASLPMRLREIES